MNVRDLLEVVTSAAWLEMRVGHDFEGYYLEAGRFSFYPKRVYARLMNEEGQEG